MMFSAFSIHTRGAHLSPPFISLYSIDFFNKSPFKRLQTTDNKKMKQKKKVDSKKFFLQPLERSRRDNGLI